MDLDLSTIPPSHVRNFGIIAHIDHGKSTLADRLMELTGCIRPIQSMTGPVLDNLPVERQRGITVKTQAVTMFYHNHNAHHSINSISTMDSSFLINLLDTPGHADFSNEVTRSLVAIQGVLLVVDATQGIQAQTVAHYHRVRESGLETKVIIPVINKIDLPTADPLRVQRQLQSELQLKFDDPPLLISAKTGYGVETILPAIIKHIPPHPGTLNAPVQAVVIDCWYQEYYGVICLVRVKEGSLRVGQKLQSIKTAERILTIDGLGILRPHPVATSAIGTGQVGWVRWDQKDIREIVIGDVLYDVALKPFSSSISFTSPITRSSPPLVFASFFPETRDDYDETADAIQKLLLNDASVHMERQHSPALGVGWRLGFRGSLHLDVFAQRLEQEFGVRVIVTPPTVRYRYQLKGENDIWHEISSADDFPDEKRLARVRSFTEPYVEARITFPTELFGSITKLCSECRMAESSIVASEQDGDGRSHLIAIMPLAEIIGDFSGRLLSLSSGYASVEYRLVEERAVKLVRVTLKLNGDPLEMLSVVHPAERADRAGRALVESLVKILPRQQFAVAIQATIGNRVIARETLSALCKNVIAKCVFGFNFFTIANL